MPRNFHSVQHTLRNQPTQIPYSKKLWRIESLQSIGEKKLANEDTTRFLKQIICQAISTALFFRQVHFTFASYRVRARVRKIVGMASSRFTVESVIHGYHVCKSIWLNPVMEE